MLDDVEADPSTEQPQLHLAPTAELRKLNSPEALFQIGYRLRNGIKLPRDEEEGWRLTVEAARGGHPVGLGNCLHHGRSCRLNYERAAQLYKESAERMHPLGKRQLFDSHEASTERARLLLSEG